MTLTRNERSELRDARAKFKAAGGRGVDLAETIDRLTTKPRNAPLNIVFDAPMKYPMSRSGMNHWPKGHNPTPAERRAARLAPGGVPRWVRVYDNGGDPDTGGSGDRYTVVYTGRMAPERSPGRTDYPYRAMSEHPFHPQGIGQYGATTGGPCDTLNHAGTGKQATGNWPPAMGRKCHLGRRIRFQDLPEDCRRCAWQDYAAIWSIPMPERI